MSLAASTKQTTAMITALLSDMNRQQDHDVDGGAGVAARGGIARDLTAVDLVGGQGRQHERCDGDPQEHGIGDPCGRGSRRARTRVPVTLLG
jgi:hypothetical protein